MKDGAVIGIDVGCSPTRRSSAICRLQWSAASVSWQITRFRAAEPEREQAIGRLAGGGPVIAAAFDGPIRRGFEIIGRYRMAERMLTRRLRPLSASRASQARPSASF